MTRFFLASVLGGRLHPNGISPWGPWDVSRLHWWEEDHLDKVIGTMREWKVQTVEELESALKEPMRVSPTRDIWVHEDLEGEARRVWEAGRVE